MQKRESNLSGVWFPIELCLASSFALKHMRRLWSTEALCPNAEPCAAAVPEEDGRASPCPVPRGAVARCGGGPQGGVEGEASGDKGPCKLKGMG